MERNRLIKIFVVIVKDVHFFELVGGHYFLFKHLSH